MGRTSGYRGHMIGPNTSRTAFFSEIMDSAYDIYLKYERNAIQAHNFRCVCEITKTSMLNSRSFLTISERHPQWNWLLAKPTQANLCSSGILLCVRYPLSPCGGLNKGSQKTFMYQSLNPASVPYVAKKWTLLMCLIKYLEVGRLSST